GIIGVPAFRIPDVVLVQDGVFERCFAGRRKRIHHHDMQETAVPGLVRIHGGGDHGHGQAHRTRSRFPVEECSLHEASSWLFILEDSASGMPAFSEGIDLYPGVRTPASIFPWHGPTAAGNEALARKIISL